MQWLPRVGEMKVGARGIFREAKPSSTILLWWRKGPSVQTRRMYNTDSTVGVDLGQSQHVWLTKAPR